MSDFTDNYGYEVRTDFKGDHKADVLLQWQTTPPTAPGAYWAKVSFFGEIIVEMVTAKKQEAFFDEETEWRVYRPGSEIDYDLTDRRFVSWLGPLPEPEKPS